jgi:DNA-binding HxlR family transcriptional regulator
MFKGLRTFNEFLAAGEGIASNILTDRLAKLEATGILTKSPDASDARRFHYRLTQKGIDLAPALVEIVLWSSRYEDSDAPAGVIRAMSSNREKFLAEIRKRWAVAG